MAIETAIINNMHRAIDERNFDQIERGEKALAWLEEQKANGFVDYSDPQRELIYYPLRSTITIDDRPVSLSAVENRVVGYLSQLRDPQPYALVDELLENCWDSKVNRSSVGTIVSKIRNKIEIDSKNPQHLLSARRKGYRLNGVSVNMTDQAPI